MTEQDAQRLGAAVLDAGLDATIIPIERGDRYCVCIQHPQWYLWSFADWNAFCKEAKKQRRKRRNMERSQVGIDPQEAYRLVFA